MVGESAVFRIAGRSSQENRTTRQHRGRGWWFSWISCNIRGNSWQGETHVREFRFAGRPIGPGHPVFIIAEAGVNHDGRLDRAKELVDAAKEAGADAVKFQTFKTERLVARGTAMAAYQAANTGHSGDQADLLRGLELSEADFQELFAYAGRRGMPIFSTPDEEVSADLLEQLDMPVFKIGSGEVTNLPFLRHLAAKGRPLILSTGMATLAETAAAVEAIGEAGNPPLALLHCVSLYPAPVPALNLRAMPTLAATFGVPVGFSDHTLGRDAAVAAVTLGACIIEKHLTIDRFLPGPDHRSSLDPAEFKVMVAVLRQIQQALGHGRKEPAAVELPTRAVVRKGVVAAVPLKAGAVLTATDLLLKRTTDQAVLPVDLDKLPGLRIHRDLQPDDPVTWADLHSPVCLTGAPGGVPDGQA